MDNLVIRIDIKRLKDYSASLDKTKKKKTLLLMIEYFAQYISNLYLILIEEAINSRRYRGKWEPVNEEKYIDYIGTTPTTDILILLKESLEIKRVGYYFLIRINPSYKYPGTKIPFIKVVRAIEFGTSEFNARPILRKIIKDINSNILRLWKGYLTMKGVS